MSRTRTWSAAVLAFLGTCVWHAALSPRPASAQQSVTPNELTQAILRYVFRYEGGNARLLEGRVPDDLGPNFFAPPGTRVLGSVILGSGVLVLAKSSMSPDSLRAAYARGLEPRGWKPLDLMRRRGFVDASTDLPLILCRDGAQLHVQHLSRSGESNDLFLHYRDTAGPCEQPRIAAFRAAPEPPFPTLHAPPRASGQSITRCFSQTEGRRGSTGTTTTISADMPAEGVLRHYGNQLEAEGWRPAGAGSRGFAAGTWTRPDTAGTSELTLQVRETGPPGVRCYRAEMSVETSRR